MNWILKCTLRIVRNMHTLLHTLVLITNGFNLFQSVYYKWLLRCLIILLFPIVHLLMYEEYSYLLCLVLLKYLVDQCLVLLSMSLVLSEAHVAYLCWIKWLTKEPGYLSLKSGFRKMPGKRPSFNRKLTFLFQTVFYLNQR